MHSVPPPSPGRSDGRSVGRRVVGSSLAPRPWASSSSSVAGVGRASRLRGGFVAWPHFARRPEQRGAKISSAGADEVECAGLRSSQGPPVLIGLCECRHRRRHLSQAAEMLPLSLLKTAQGHPMLVELKNGETYNGHLVNCDTWMNIHLREVICTSKDGDRFWRMPECYIRGNTIKYLRVPDEIEDPSFLVVPEAAEEGRKVPGEPVDEVDEAIKRKATIELGGEPLVVVLEVQEEVVVVGVDLADEVNQHQERTTGIIIYKNFHSCGCQSDVLHVAEDAPGFIFKIRSVGFKVAH
ncbi:hypothetical protein AXG93_1712s1120 [Marchantia polymorpha subsp. ruderalis]|uniref:Sm domain-containing protein n=1 Tax=Marchantia polymorpha subsp. ruderalis TaxID=1480154 RepID=A0A176VYQ7_MARPO|nr:hypothetical protein AXG93_1712s1120 [Marchantia polymorpha subsp. ruderalis]